MYSTFNKLILEIYESIFLKAFYGYTILSFQADIHREIAGLDMPLAEFSLHEKSNRFISKIETKSN